MERELPTSEEASRVKISTENSFTTLATEATDPLRLLGLRFYLIFDSPPNPLGFYPRGPNMLSVDQKPRTLYDKVFQDHIIDERDDGTILLYIGQYIHRIPCMPRFS